MGRFNVAQKSLLLLSLFLSFTHSFSFVSCSPFSSCRQTFTTKTKDLQAFNHFLNVGGCFENSKNFFRRIIFHRSIFFFVRIFDRSEELKSKVMSMKRTANTFVRWPCSMLKARELWTNWTKWHEASLVPFSLFSSSSSTVANLILFFTRSLAFLAFFNNQPT